MRKILSLLFLLSAFTMGWTQSREWSFAIGDNSAQTAKDAAIDDDGNISVVGHFLGDVDFDPGAGESKYNASGIQTGYLASYAPNGDHKFSVALTSSTSATVSAVAVDANGDIFIAGTFENTLNLPGVTSLSNTGMAAFVAKYDTISDEFDWAEKIDFGEDVIVGDIDTDGTDAYVIGHYDVGGSFRNEIFVRKFNGTTGGAPLISASYTGSQDDFGCGIVVPSSGDHYFIAGSYKVFVDFGNSVSLSGGSMWEGYLAKFEKSDGDAIEAIAVAGTSDTKTDAITLDSDGDLWIGGRFTNFVTPPGGTQLAGPGSMEDLFFAKYDNALNFVRSGALGATGDDVLTDLEVDVANRLYIVGQFANTMDLDPGATTDSKTAAGTDLFVSILDTDGGYRMGYQIGGTSSIVAPAGLGVISSEKWVLHGSFDNSNVDFDPDGDTHTMTHAGNGDMFVVQLTAPDITGPIPPTVNPLVTVDQTPQLTGTYDDSDGALTQVEVNGQTYLSSGSDLTVNAGSWTLDIPIANALPEGVYDVTMTAEDPITNPTVEVAVGALDVDLTAPTVAITPLTTNDQTPELEGTVDDNTATISVNVDGSNYPATNNGDGSWTLVDNTITTLAENTYEVVVTATDVVGNSDVDPSSNELVIDLTAPVVTVDPVLSKTPRPALSGTVNDNAATINVHVDGSDYPATNNGDGTWSLAQNTIAPLSEGIYELTITATDVAGNAGVDGSSNELEVDLTEPVVSINALETFDQTPELTGSVDDNTATISVNVDGSDYPATNNGDGTWTLADNTVATLAEATYDVVVTATDPAGNEGLDATADELIIDITAPNVTISALIANDQTPPLSGSVDDNTATISVNVDGSDYPATNNGDGTWVLADNTVSTIPEGTYDVTVTATDVAGNDGVDATSDELIIDLTAPTVTVNSLETNNQRPALSGTVNDNDATISVNVNSADYPATNNGDGTWSLAEDIIAPLVAGTYELTVTATDLASNSDTDATSNELIIDLTAPTVSVDASETNDPTPELTGTVNDNSASISVNVDGSDYPATNNGDGTWTLADNTVASLAAATYEVTVTATDLAGNAGTDATSDELIIDLTAPTVSVNARETNDQTPELTGSVNDNAATISVNVDGSDYPATNNGDGTWTLADNTIASLAAATYEVTITATDVAGNNGTDATSNELVVDLTAPTVAINVLVTKNQRPELTGSIDDPLATIVAEVNSITYPITNNGDGTWTLAENTIAPLPEAIYSVDVTATDVASNVGTEATSNELTIDLTGPTVTINALISNDQTPEMDGTVDDPAATISVNVDGSDYPATNNGDGSWTLADNIVVTIAEGVYDVIVTATDVADNAETDATTDELEIDITNPTVTVTGVSTSNTSPSLSGTLSELTSSVTITVDGNNYPASTATEALWTLDAGTITPALANGTYEVSVSVTDLAGNIGTDGTSNELIIDTSAPTVTIDVLVTMDVTPQLTGTVSDPAATINVNVDGSDYGATNNGNGTWTLADNTITTLSEGIYNVVVTATDLSSNEGTDATSNELTIDLTDPVVTIDVLVTNDQTPPLSGTIDDPDATISILVDGNGYAATNNGDGTWTIADDVVATLAEATWELSATATDIAGNAGVDATSDELKIDITDPVVTITALVTNDQTPQLSGTVDDPIATININVNSADYPATNNGDGTWTLADNTIATLGEAIYEVTVTGTDDADNAGVDITSNELEIDLTAPSVTVTALETNDQTPQLDGTVDDPAATISVNVDGGDYPATNNGDGTWTLADNTVTSLAAGTFEVTVTATDNVGNDGFDGSSNELIIDLTAPIVTINSEETNDQTPALGGTVNDPNATINVNVDGGDYAATNNGDGTWTLADNVIASLAEGIFEVTVTATDIAGNPGIDGSSNEVDIDLTEPTVTVTALLTKDQTPELTGTVDDPLATVSINVNGSDYGATNNGDGTWTLVDNTVASLPQATYEVVATSTDVAGNVGTDGTSNELEIDIAAPLVTILPVETNDQTPELDGTVDDAAATISVNVDGSDYPATNNGDGTWTLADNTIVSLGAGTYEVVVTATDNADNDGVDGTNNELIIDLTPPAITVNSVETNDQTPELRGTVDDPLATININVDGSNYAATNNGDGTWTLADNTVASLGNGIYNIAATATDIAGNDGDDATNNELTIDLVAPTVTINALTINDLRPPLDGTVDDPLATIGVNVNGNDYAATNNGDGTWGLDDNTIAPLSQTTYEVVITATDVAGNDGFDATSNELVIDLTPPAVSIASIVTNDQTPQLGGTVDDPNASISVHVDGSDYPATNNGDGTWTLPDNSTAGIGEGTYEVTITATDIAGNPANDATTQELEIDLTPPTVTIVSFETNDATPALNGTIDDAAATISVNVDGSDYPATNNGNGTWTLADNTIASLSEATYEVVVTATDLANNAGTDATSNELIIDVTAPIVTVNSLTTMDETPELSGTIDDPEASINVNVNGINYSATNLGATWTATVTNSLPEADYEVVATSIDDAGNESVDASTNELELDLTAPVVAIDPLNSSDNTPELTGTVDDTNSTVVVTVDGENYTATVVGTDWSVVVTSALIDGTYNVEVNATDAVGNVGTDGSSDELVLSGTGVTPTVTISPVATFDFTPPLSGEVDDADATIEVSIDGADYAATNNGDGTWSLADDVIAALDVDTYDVIVSATSPSNLVGTDNTGDELQILPAATTLNDPTDINVGSFRVAWETLDGGVDSYIVEVSEEEDFSTILASYQRQETDDPFVVVTGLQYARTYYARAQVQYNSSDLSEYSNSVNATTLSNPSTELDSLALVALYDETGGGNWTESTNWKEDRLDSWFGVTVVDGRVVGLDLPDNNLTGAILNVAAGLDLLEDLDLSNNDLTGIGDLTPLVGLATVDVSGNRLSFGHFQNIVATGADLTLDNQGELLEPISVLREQGSPYTFDREISGSGNEYRWFKNDELLAQTDPTFELDISSFDQEGAYHVEVTNAQFEGVTLVTTDIALRVSSLERDRESLLALYNATGGDNWTNGADWPNNPNIETWEGVTVSGNRVIALMLKNSNVVGEVPDAILDIVNLEFLDLAQNSITRLPDLRGLEELIAPDVSENMLDFDDLEHNIDIPTLNYRDQRPPEGTEVRLRKGSDYLLSADVGGAANIYQWFFEGVAVSEKIAGAESASYFIEHLDYDKMGVYTAHVSNQMVPNLTVTSAPQTILAVVDMKFSPTYRDIDNDTAPLDEGQGYLLKVTEPGMPFDTLADPEVTSEGLIFEDVVLGDYLIALRTDTLLIRSKNSRTDSVRLLPTYYKSTFLWEEADTLRVRDEVDADLRMQQRPTNVAVGRNEVSLLVESDFAEDIEGESRVQTRRKVKRAGCSLRRRRRATGGRGANEAEDEYELIAYKETDDNGRVTFGDLPDGDYRLSIEYPGIPMDPNSFIEFKIGEGGLEQTSLTLEATVDETGIEVQLINILTVAKEYFTEIDVYPNPADRDLNISYKGLNSDDVAAQLVDLQGRLIMEHPLVRSMESVMTLDVSAVKRGIYLLRLVDPSHANGFLVYKVRVDR